MSQIWYTVEQLSVYTVLNFKGHLSGIALGCQPLNIGCQRLINAIKILKTNWERRLRIKDFLQLLPIFIYSFESFSIIRRISCFAHAFLI